MAPSFSNNRLNCVGDKPHLLYLNKKFANRDINVILTSCNVREGNGTRARGRMVLQDDNVNYISTNVKLFQLLFVSYPMVGTGLGLLSPQTSSCALLRRWFHSTMVNGLQLVLYFYAVSSSYHWRIQFLLTVQFIERPIPLGNVFKRLHLPKEIYSSHDWLNKWNEKPFSVDNVSVFGMLTDSMHRLCKSLWFLRKSWYSIDVNIDLNHLWVFYLWDKTSVVSKVHQK